LEQEIAALERRQIELTSELENSETYQKPGRAVEVNRELSGVIDSLARLSQRWELQATNGL
jgi:hypothetical protein